MRNFKRATSTVARANPLQWPSLRTRDTHTSCWAFGNWAVTTCYECYRSVLTADRTPICCWRGERSTISPPWKWLYQVAYHQLHSKLYLIVVNENHVLYTNTVKYWCNLFWNNAYLIGLMVITLKYKYRHDTKRKHTVFPNVYNIHKFSSKVFML